MARLWVLNLSDGRHSLLDVADRSGLPFRDVKEAARVLYENSLLSEAPGGGVFLISPEPWVAPCARSPTPE